MLFIKYILLALLICLIVYVTPKRMNVSTKCVLISSIVVVISILVDFLTSKSVEFFDEVSQFDKTQKLYQQIKDNNNIDLKTFEGGYLQDKYDIIKQANELYSQPADMKKYFDLAYRPTTTTSMTSPPASMTSPPTTVSPPASDPQQPIPVMDEAVQKKPNVKRDEEIPIPPQTSEPSKLYSEQEVSDIVNSALVKKRNDWLDKPEYKEKDPLYYTSKGELIDNSWDNQYVILDTKHWKPYITPPPICAGKDDPCDTCPTIMHMPYLELRNFDKASQITK